MKKLFNNARIEQATEFILDELRTFLDQKAGGSSLSEAMSKGCAAYKAGLTIGETRLAIMRALALMGSEINCEFAGLLYDNDDDFDEAA